MNNNISVVNLPSLKLILLTVPFIVLMLPFSNAFASWNPATEVPSYFGPEGRPMSDISAWAKPNEMTNILPNRPVAAKDKYGNRLYFTPNGKMTLRVGVDGSMEFALKSKTIEKDADGKVTQESTNKRGTNVIEVKNEKGEILGYKETGLGNRVLKEYDYQKNLVKTTNYDKYGKNAEWLLNELSQTKTVFDKKGLPKNDIDFEGNIVASYKNDEQSRLMIKQDIYGNMTYFNKNGNMTHTEDIDNNLVMNYKYEKDTEGNFELVQSEDMRKGDITHFVRGKQQYTINPNGVKSKEYFWDGSKLVYSFADGIDETTYYNLNGKEVYTSHNELLVKEWLYSKGRMVGLYDVGTHTTLILQYQRDDVTMYTESAPDAELIQKWYDSGLIKDFRVRDH